MDKLTIGIIGVAGYVGAELLRLSTAHPRLRLARVAGNSSAGKRLDEVLPPTIGSEWGGMEIQGFDPQSPEEFAAGLDVVFTALPHAHSARAGASLLRAGCQVVDLSADYRLKDPAVYEEWYGPHPEKETIQHARYGLVEWHRDQLKDARLIAAPGCYPTAAVTALGPLLEAGLVESDNIVIDAKSGVSGAGRTASPSTHLPECAEGIRPYKVAGAHRHTVEIEQELSAIANKPLKVIFTPHLTPMTRGILCCAYARAAGPVSVEQCREAARRRYAQGLVRLLGEGQLPDTLWVRGSAVAVVNYAVDQRTGMVLAMSAIDNLAKGAAAQAIQALNVSRGWTDGLGLPILAQYP